MMLNGQEVKYKTIDFDNLTPDEHYAINKIRLLGTHNEAASQEAMVIGVYKILSVKALPSKLPQDNPKRYIAKALIKEKLNGQFDEDEIIDIRLNPLFNQCAKGNGSSRIKQETGIGMKCDKLFEALNNKIIHVKSIKLEHNSKYNSSSYVYDWDCIR